MTRRDLLWATSALLGIATMGGCTKRPVSRDDAGTILPDALDVAGPEASSDGQDEPSSDVPGLVGSVVGADVVVGPTGNVVVVGTLEGSVDLGAGALTSAGAGDLLLAAFSPAGSLLWNRRWGEGAIQGGGAVAADRAGNVFLATSFSGQIDLGGGALVSAGSSDICLAKLDAAGGHQWSKRFGDAGFQWATGAAADSTGRFVAAGYSQTPFDFGGNEPDAGVGNANVTSSIVVLDASGNRVWSQTWPGAQVTSLVVDTSDNVVVVGSFTSSVDFGGGPLTSAGRTDMFVVALAANGAHRWSKRFGGVGSAAALAVATDTDRNVLLAGFFDDTLDFGGVPLVSAPSPTRTVVSRDVFVAKLDGTAGNHIWSRRFGDAEGDQSSMSIAADGAGNVFVAGSFEVTIDFGLGVLSAGLGETWVAKLDPGGTPVWSTQLAGPGGQIGVAPPAGLLVTGGFPAGGRFGSASDTLIGGANVFLVEYPP